MRSSTRRSRKSPANSGDVPIAIRREWIIVCACVFAASLAVLWWNAAPSVTFHDSGEFAMAAASAGIPHPPGAPTWTILATIFVKLGRFHDPARGTNLFSGLCGAITLALLCGLTQLWVHLLYPAARRWIPPASGIVTALLLLHSSAFLEQSFTTEQYTILTALLAAILLVCTAIVLREKADRPRTGLAVLLGVLWGLAIGNHLSQICLVFLVVWALWAGPARESRLRSFAKLGAACFGGLALGLMVFLWLPIRSRANPIIDWGNIKTLDRFVWAITRRQWETRPISAAPRNLVGDWLASYDFAGQIGILGLILLAVGTLILIRRQRMWLGWLAAASIPYAAGMLYAHLRQKTIGIDYVVGYGVFDWHLPIYLTLAVGAGIGFAALSLWMKPRIFAWVLALAVIGLLIASDWAVIGHQSLRHYAAPEQFMRDLLAPLPPDAAIVSAQDNIAFMLGYRKWVADPNARYWIAVLAYHPWMVMKSPRMAGMTPDERKLEFLRCMTNDPNRQPFRVPQFRVERRRIAGAVCDFLPTHPNDRTYLLPAGYLFEFAGRPVSNAEVREAERRWRERFPDLFRKRPSDAHRLECEAYSRLHMERGVFFAERAMWPESVDAYARSLDWNPRNGFIWFYYADSLEHVGSPNQALDAYKRAIVCIPMYSAPRYNLAMMYARHGQLREAEQLLAEALRIAPNSKMVRDKLAQIRAKLGGR